MFGMFGIMDRAEKSAAEAKIHLKIKSFTLNNT